MKSQGKEESVSRPGQLTGYNADVSQAKEDWPGTWTVCFKAIWKGLWDSISFGLGVDKVKGPEDRDTIARQRSVRAGKPPSCLLREGGGALADAITGGPGETLKVNTVRKCPVPACPLQVFNEANSAGS